jgi:DNA-binding NarL/FixJ family response regulator
MPNPTSAVILRRVPITVAIVEDDPATRGIVAGWVDGLPNFRCVARYGDAEAALAALPDVAPDVVLTDINLPELNGIECVRQLKPQLPRTQFVMVTVYGDTDHIFEALAAGATGYLLKRLDRDELKEALEEVHRGGSPMSSSIARKVVQFFRSQQPSTTVALESLSPRELEVLNLLAEGYVNKEIADRLAISVPTVATYIRRVYEKLHVHSRAAAIGKFSSLRSKGPVPPFREKPMLRS